MFSLVRLSPTHAGLLVVLATTAPMSACGAPSEAEAQRVSAPATIEPRVDRLAEALTDERMAGEPVPEVDAAPTPLEGPGQLHGAQHARGEGEGDEHPFQEDQGRDQDRADGQADDDGEDQIAAGALLDALVRLLELLPGMRDLLLEFRARAAHGLLEGAVLALGQRGTRRDRLRRRHRRRRSAGDSGLTARLGEDGLWYAMPAADLLLFALTLAVLRQAAPRTPA